MLPLVSSMEWSVAVDLAIALVLGAGFGFSLERAGFGSARKLTAVFYLWDMAVVKVMFTAIVTAMAGLFVLSSLGAMSLGDLFLEPTSLAAQGLGGLVFGAGFVVGGYCPGTSIAAMATGRKDAMVFALGMLAGVWAFAQLTPGLDAWIEANALGELTLPSVTGIGMGWWVVGFLAFLAFAGWGMRALERRFARLRPREGKPPAYRQSGRHRGRPSKRAGLPALNGSCGRAHYLAEAGARSRPAPRGADR